MHNLAFTWLRRNSVVLLIPGLAALTLGGCPPTGTGNGNNNNDNTPPGQDLVTVTNNGEGTVTQTANGNMVTLTAVPADGWTFDGWSGADGIDQSANPLVVDATQISSITANFIEDNQPPPRPLDVCGNGVVDRGEQCDDGNTVDGDGCSSTCQIETPSPARCGDGVVNGTEQCDAGGETSTCNADCTNSRCGDGTVNVHAGEQCDDGNTVNGDGCSSSCHTETPPPPSGCGDGVVNGTEECDGEGSETATCNTNCTTSRCGDSIVNTLAGEQCDDGNQVSGDGCSSTCQIETTTPPPPPPPSGIPNDDCADAIAVTDGTRSYSNLGATTDGPDEPTMCNFFGRTNVEADIWYCYTASCTGTALVSLCGSDYDTKLAVYAGCDCPTAAPLACSDDDCGTGVENVQSRVTFAATAGQKYLLRVGGYPIGVCRSGFCTAGTIGAPCTADAQCHLGEQGDVRLTIGCNVVDACRNDSRGCFVASPTEGAGCGDATCCGKTCDLDQFCCDVTWDAFCAGEAEGVCDGSFRACGPGSGVCGTPSEVGVCTLGFCTAGTIGAPCTEHAQCNRRGCDNVSCCNTVCMSDPFCCLTAWDSTCVDEANSMCFLTCGRGAGDCHAAHTTPGCGADACCQAVCTEDPFCCDTNWDQACVDDAAASPSCP